MWRQWRVCLSQDTPSRWRRTWTASASITAPSSCGTRSRRRPTSSRQTTTRLRESETSSSQVLVLMYRIASCLYMFCSLQVGERTGVRRASRTSVEPHSSSRKAELGWRFKQQRVERAASVVCASTDSHDAEQRKRNDLRNDRRRRRSACRRQHRNRCLKLSVKTVQ